MYICICKGVTEKDLIEVVKTCGSSIENVQNVCGAGTDCGACWKKLEKFLGGEAALLEAAPPSESVFPKNLLR